MKRAKYYISTLVIIIFLSLYFTNNTTSPLTGFATSGCTENWYCSDFTVCKDSSQERICVDLNSCGTTTSKPQITQSCTDRGGGTGDGQGPSNPPSCSDGIKNQGEENIDCGGPCQSCSNKISLFLFYILVPVIIVSILVVIVFLVIKKKEKPYNALIETDFSTPHNKELDDYISKALDDGLSIKDIEENLIAVGWPKDLVKKTLTSASPTPVTGSKNSDIGKYIKDSIKEGYSLEQIKDNLSKVGWPIDEINDKLKKYKKLSILSRYRI